MYDTNTWKRIERIHGQHSAARDKEIARLHSIEQVSAARIKRLYLKRTLCSLTTELLKVKRNFSAVPGKGPNGHSAVYYSFTEIVAFFGGVDALFHRDDYPDLFIALSEGARSSGKPSMQHRTNRSKLS